MKPRNPQDLGCRSNFELYYVILRGMMPSPRIIIHIGSEKTGTTTLQDFLNYNAAKLRDLGFHYPNNNNEPYFELNAHFPLAATLLAPTDPKAFISPAKKLTLDEAQSSLAQEIRATDKAVILSCEHFSSRVIELGKLVDFKNTLQSCASSIKIVCYVRETTAFALSAYSSELLSGRRKPFDPDEVLPTNKYYNALIVLDFWASAFEKDNIIVREYDKNILLNGDICADFCALVGIDYSHLAPQSHLNTSLDATQAETLRQLNLLLPSLQESEELWREAQQLRNFVILSLIPKGKKKLSALLSESDRRKVLERFRSINEELNARYMNGRLTKNWFLRHDDIHLVKEMDPAIDPGVDEAVVCALSKTIISLAEECKTARHMRPLLDDAQTKLLEAQEQLKHTQELLADTEEQLRQHKTLLAEAPEANAMMAAQKHGTFGRIRKQLGSILTGRSR